MRPVGAADNSRCDGHRAEASFQRHHFAHVTRGEQCLCSSGKKQYAPDGANALRATEPNDALAHAMRTWPQAWTDLENRTAFAEIAAAVIPLQASQEC